MRYNIIQPYRDLPTSTNQNICGNDTLHLMWHGWKVIMNSFNPELKKIPRQLFVFLNFRGNDCSKLLRLSFSNHFKYPFSRTLNKCVSEHLKRYFTHWKKLSIKRPRRIELLLAIDGYASELRKILFNFATISLFWWKHTYYNNSKWRHDPRFIYKIQHGTLNDSFGGNTDCHNIIDFNCQPSESYISLLWGYIYI